MRVFSKNINRSIITHWKTNLLILGDLILCAVMIFIMLQNYFLSSFQYRRFYSHDHLAQTYNISAQYDSSDNPFNVDSPMYDIGLQVKDRIYNHDMWEAYFLCIDTVPVDSFWPDMPKDFEINTSLSIGTDDSFPAFYVSEYAVRLQNIELLEGRDFVDSDYQMSDSPKPVILGYDFVPYFDVGDMLGDIKTGPIEVIGFLSENSFIFIDGGEPYNLNSSIFMSRYIIDLTNYLDSSAGDLGLFLSGGSLVLHNPQTDVQAEINKITAEMGYYSIVCEPLDGSVYSNTEFITQKNLSLLFVLTIISSVLCLIALSNILYRRTLKDQATFCVYLLSGIPLWKINLSVILELALWTGLSVISAIALSYFEYGQIFVSIWHIVGFMSLIVLVSLIPVFSLTRKINLDVYIRSRSE